MVAPMPARVQVVRSMIPIVEAVPVAGHVDQSDGGTQVGSGIDVVDKGVLAPVTDHQCDAHLQQGQHEHEERGAEVLASADVDEGVRGEFRDEGPDGQSALVLAEEVHWEIDPDEEEETTNVVEEMYKLVALVADRAGEVVGAVGFGVVVFDVVVIVRVPGVAHQGF